MIMQNSAAQLRCHNAVLTPQQTFRRRHFLNVSERHAAISRQPPRVQTETWGGECCGKQGQAKEVKAQKPSSPPPPLVLTGEDLGGGGNRGLPIEAVLRRELPS